MELWIGALNLGLLYAFLAIGSYITFRVLNFSDITVDGSFTLGAAISAVLVVSGVNPFIALGGAFLAGAVAGALTGLIHTRLNIDGLLSGILVMIGLYSINLHIMGKSNIPLLNKTVFTTTLLAYNPGMSNEVWLAVCLMAIMIVFWLLVSLFFRTDLGLSLRSTGSNQIMTSASGVSVQLMKIFGIALSNGLVGLAGGLVAQYQGFADIGMGIGCLIIGLASVIIGESILRSKSIYFMALSAILGSVIYRFMIAFALKVGMNPIDLKLLTAGFVLITLIITKLTSSKGNRGMRGKYSLNSLIGFFKNHKKSISIALGVIILAGGSFFVYNQFIHKSKKYKIGIIQLSDAEYINSTRKGFLKEMEKLGYKDDCEFIFLSANGDISQANSIIDKFVSNNVDLIFSITTPCTQAAINRTKTIPIVFTTVANPFIVGAGQNDSVHQSNVTGSYGSIPMDKFLEIVARFFPDDMAFGTIWNQGFSNSAFNATNLKNATQGFPKMHFIGTTVSNTSEVLEAATSLMDQNINAFVLPPDDNVFSALESILKIANSKRIPVFVSDMERLGDGVFCAYGYDYSKNGAQAAHYVDRILHGETPATIPFEKYKEIELGFDIKIAKQLGIEIPQDLMPDVTRLVGYDPVKTDKMYKIGVVQFGVEPNVEVCKRGIIHALAANGYIDGKNIEIIYKNANADFSMINAIMQDLVQRETDIIVPLSTPVVQGAIQQAQGTKTKVVFTYIYDPYKIGAATSPEDHIPNMTGIACFPPLQNMLGLIKEMFPDRQKVGIVWNSSEANSESVVQKIRKYASEVGLEILEATVTSPAEILEASQSLADRGANVFLNPGDNTLNVGFDSFVKVANTFKIPVFSTDAELIYNGAIAALGPNYYQTGYEGGEYLARVLGGENTATMPIHQTEGTLFYYNRTVAKKMGFNINPELIKKANKIIDTDKQDESNKGEKKLALFLFSENVYMMLAKDAVMKELENSGVLSKYNIKVDFKLGQNDFDLAQSIANDITHSSYDYVITLSTPALQVMANANKTIPHIFGAVTDPFRMGIATDVNNHQSNITGVATFQPVESSIKLMRDIFPNARKIGIIWNPAEACSEACTYIARDVAQRYNFTLIEKNVSQTTEIVDALNSLISSGIDIYFTSGDNTVSLATPTIASICEKKKIPFFTNTYSDVELGAFATLGADYYEVGTETAKLAVRVIQGEPTVTLPIEKFVPEKIYINQSLAARLDIDIPESILSKANKVLR